MLVTDDNWIPFLQWVSAQPILAVDTETTGLQPFHESGLAGISVGNRDAGHYFPVGHGEGFNHPKHRLNTLLSAIAACPRIVMFNGTFDLNFLGMAGLPPRQRGSLEEVQVAAHLHNENDFHKYLGRKPGLKELADKYLGPGSSTPEEKLQERLAMRFGKVKAYAQSWKGLMWRLPAEVVEPYASADALLTMRLRDYFVDYIRRANLGSLYAEICDYTILLQQLSFNGVRVDRPLCEALWMETREAADAAAKQFRELAGNPDFNMNSAPQLHHLFGEPSVTRALLNQWIKSWEAEEAFLDDEERNRFEMARTLCAFRDADKMHSSYFDKYLPLLDKNDRLHASFNVIGTETGRLSCREPNLQAIPRDEEKHKVKLLFIPGEKGGRMVEMDYAQAEMRLASFYGSEWTMAGILESGVDMHQATADLIGCDRNMAKRINFSAIYGIGPAKFSATYDVPFEDSVRHLENYHAAYPGFRRLYREAENFAAQRHALILPSGRIRHYFLPKGKLQDPEALRQVNVLNFALATEEHKASSNLVQGMVAAVMQKAMLRIWRELPEMKMVLTVHDSLIFDIPAWVSDRQANGMIWAAKTIMEEPSDDIAYRFHSINNRPNCAMKVDVKVTTERLGRAEKW